MEPWSVSTATTRRGVAEPSVTRRVTWQSGTIINRFLTSSPADSACASRAVSISNGTLLNLLKGKKPDRGGRA